MAVTSIDPTAAYLPALAGGRAEAVLALFSGDPLIDDPRAGRIAGGRAVREFVTAQAKWVREHRAEFELLRTTAGRGLSLTETLAHLTVNGERTELPIAVVGEVPGGSLRALRIYHSNWPLEGRHRLRAPIVPENPGLILPDIVGAYMEALHSANLEGSMSVFEPDGYFREPSGGPHIYRGPEGIRSAYGAFYAVGPIHLRHCTVIDDGVACGVEFIAD
ncbi:MAG: nuclear transport factor 2 family protein, partial [Candidatus Limnocylindrales bacterium]